MPVIIIDSEQAALIAIALSMLEGALTARVARADPDKVISNSLQLQANKLNTVLTLLQLPDPPDLSDLDPSLRSKAEHLIASLADPDNAKQFNDYWRILRGVINAPGHPVS